MILLGSLILFNVTCAPLFIIAPLFHILCRCISSKALILASVSGSGSRSCAASVIPRSTVKAAAAALAKARPPAIALAVFTARPASSRIAAVFVSLRTAIAASSSGLELSAIRPVAAETALRSVVPIALIAILLISIALAPVVLTTVLLAAILLVPVVLTPILLAAVLLAPIVLTTILLITIVLTTILSCGRSVLLTPFASFRPVVLRLHLHDLRLYCRLYRLFLRLCFRLWLGGHHLYARGRRRRRQRLNRRMNGSCILFSAVSATVILKTVSTLGLPLALLRPSAISAPALAVSLP